MGPRTLIQFVKSREEPGMDSPGLWPTKAEDSQEKLATRGQGTQMFLRKSKYDEDQEELAFGVGNTEAARDLDKRSSDKTVKYEPDWMGTTAVIINV